jgi:hypothetical protein
MTLNSSHLRRGGIVVETAIILVVITLLVLISIPVYRGGPEDARIAQAESDILTLANAQERVGEMLGYYVPLQVLDNVEIDDEAAGLKLIPTDLTGKASPVEQETIANLREAGEKWVGPYAETKRIFLGEAGKDMDLTLISEQSVLRDFPLDPWGQPYRFYSPIGLVGSGAGDTSPEAMDRDDFSDGAITANDDRFETYAVVSYGPNGESDSVTEENDDIIYLFESGTGDLEEPEA